MTGMETDNNPPEVSLEVLEYGSLHGDQINDLSTTSPSDKRDDEVLSTDEGKTPDASLTVMNGKELVSDPLCLSSIRTPMSNLRKKLLIFDLNGLLVDIVSPRPKDCKSDVNIGRQAVFKRPFCLDFLSFCFERFDLAVWSSRSKKILDRVIDYLLGDMKQKMLFIWDVSHCTATDAKTVENRHKPLVFKELRMIWEKRHPGLPWEDGVYNESNTLLLDDSPYKALLNPPHTAIFPCSFKYRDQNDDNSLGPGGDLRVYLEELATVDNIQKFVEQHPFGQKPISEESKNWNFYCQFINKSVDKSASLSTGN